MEAEPDEHVQIARELGVFLRRVERFWSGFRAEPGGPVLERGSYLLLGQLASDGPRRLSAVAGDACLDLSTVSRQVASLEAAGLVSRATDPTDRRAILVEVTQAGHEVLGHNREKRQAALRELLAEWAPAERAEFARLFGRFNDAMARREQETKR
jgi:DNA-binding MarR family transcriptional regulator